MMRVFVAGATGAIGTRLVPRLVEAGHEVHGMTRRESKKAMLDELGAVPVVADALDPDQVAEAVGRARPDVIVHQLTALAGADLRHPERGVAMTNRVRIEGTDHLLSAGQAVGVRRFVAQSIGMGFYVRAGGPVKSEEDPLDPTPPRRLSEGAVGNPPVADSNPVRPCWQPSSESSARRRAPAWCLTRRLVCCVATPTDRRTGHTCRTPTTTAFTATAMWILSGRPRHPWARTVR
jgi:hypothetical protein